MRRSLLAGFVVAILVQGSLHAHHGYAAYDREHPASIEGDVEQLERKVLRALRRYITDGEWNDIKAVMPKELATVLP